MKKYLVVSIFFLFSISESFAANTWAITGSLNDGRKTHTATLLPNGKVLVAGGSITTSETAIASAELYDPVAATWKVTGSLNTKRCFHTATLLPNGKVLVVGGKANGAAIANAELYDPATGTWTVTATLSTARHLHTATLLPNGKVLVAGGRGSGNDFIASAELYDPSTGTWANTGSMNIARWFHTATLLPNGKVLVAAGENYSHGGRLNSAELYDSSTGIWKMARALNTARHSHTATLLPSGKVLVAGGWNYNQLTNAELYDPDNDTWTPTGSLNAARNIFSTTLLPDGKVLVAGGNNDTVRANVSSVEIYDPATGTWTYTKHLNNELSWHSATLLPNGKVLVAGGQYSNSADSTTAELYASFPFVSTISKSGLEDTNLTFSSIDFIDHFTDPSSEVLNKIKIISLPTHGTLKLVESNVAVNQEIPVANLNNLRFIPETNWNGTTSFNWNGSNGTDYAINSANINITIAASQDYPILGMVSKTGTKSNIITFSELDFINNFVDPDGYGLKKIKITSLPDCYGNLKFLNEDVKVGDEIPVNHLGDLTFVPDQDWKGGTATFNWNGSNGNLYALGDSEVSITITDNSWWIPWMGGGVIGATTAVGVGYLTYMIHKHCHHCKVDPEGNIEMVPLVKSADTSLPKSTD